MTACTVLHPPHVRPEMRSARILAIEPRDGRVWVRYTRGGVEGMLLADLFFYPSAAQRVREMMGV